MYDAPEGSMYGRQKKNSGVDLRVGELDWQGTDDGIK